MKETFPDNGLVIRRTKILATVGPASSDLQAVTELIRAGVNVFRLNMSHGTQDEHRLRYEIIRAAATSLKQPVAVLADLCGPKIRVGLFEGGGTRLEEGSLVTITTAEVLGTSTRFTTQYAALPRDVVAGSRILLDDGNLELCVERIEGTEVIATVIRGGMLKDKKGMNLPGVNVSTPALTAKDERDALFATSLGVDFIALSFVRSATDLVKLRTLLNETSSNAWIVAKIEKPEAVEAIDVLLDQCDAIMVARGDLGVELDLAKVPNVQEELVDKARRKGKPVIVATQMLESMIVSSRPTRAEVTDVANAVRSGADAVMLSAETAAGAHPIETVRTMDLIIRQTESYLYEHGAFGNFDAYTPTLHPNDPKERVDAQFAVGMSVASMSRSLAAAGIVALSTQATLLRCLSSQRPAATVYLPSCDPRLISLGCLAWGVQPVIQNTELPRDPAEVVLALENQLAEKHHAGFWLLADATGEKTASISIVST